MKRSELKEYIDSALDDALASCPNENPLEAWTTFLDVLDCRVRRSIGNELEKEGKDRYTGKNPKA